MRLWDAAAFARMIGFALHHHRTRDLLEVAQIDCDADGRYNPSRTAQREAFEEAIGPLLPDLSWITFFGLARTFKARFPFLFGELRLPITASQLLADWACSRQPGK